MIITILLQCGVKFLILGLSHKCLRMLDIPHFAGCLLNPGVGEIKVLNTYLPWDWQWFIEGVNKENYRVTHRCIKNEHNQFRPT